jgi:hypothetical protein
LLKCLIGNRTAQAFGCERFVQDLIEAESLLPKES